MKITFMGATKTVTGAKYLVDTGSKKVLVDCGLFQGHKELTQRINAEVVMLKNLSAPADYEEILAWLNHFKKPPKKVFLIHGEPESSLNLKTKIEGKFGWNCIIPNYLQVENLD